MLDKQPNGSQTDISDTHYTISKFEIIQILGLTTCKVEHTESFRKSHLNTHRVAQKGGFPFLGRIVKIRGHTSCMLAFEVLVISRSTTPFGFVAMLGFSAVVFILGIVQS